MVNPFKLSLYGSLLAKCFSYAFLFRVKVKGIFVPFDHFQYTNIFSGSCIRLVTTISKENSSAGNTNRARTFLFYISLGQRYTFQSFNFILYTDICAFMLRAQLTYKNGWFKQQTICLPL